MGFRFRKSFKVGPFRFTASKSGISSSFGVKGFRVTKRADGKTQTTVSIPGTGLSHVYTHGSRPAAQPAQAVPERARETPAPRIHYDAATFYLQNTQSVNADGQKRQDILYLYKMRRPPFEHGATASLLSDSDTPSAMQVALDGAIIGDVPAEDATKLSQIWDRVDGVHRIEVQGRRGTYDVYTVIRLICEE